MIGRTEKSMTFFAYRKHDVIYFRVIVHRSQKTFNAGRQNLVNTEIRVTDLQQVHLLFFACLLRRIDWLNIDLQQIP